MKKYYLIKLLLIFCIQTFSQNVLIEPTGITPNKSGLQSLTFEQIESIQNPEVGNLVFDKSFKCIRFFNGSKWISISYDKNDNPVSKAIINGIFPGGVYSIKIDITGNFFICGTFRFMIMTPGIGFGSPTNRFDSNPFVIKLSPDGDILWSKYFYSSSNTFAMSKFNNIEIDSSGNLYLLGTFNGGITIGGTSHSNGNYPAYTTEKLLIVKLDSLGNPVWSKSEFPNVALGKKCIKVVGDYIYIYGSFSGNSVFDGIQINSLGLNDVFIAKCEKSSGNLIWIRSFGGTDIDLAQSIDADNSGNIFISGTFSNSMSVSGSLIFSSGGKDVFLISLTPAGQTNWVRSFGGTLDDFSKDIAIPSIGSVVIVGEYSNTINIGGNGYLNKGGSDIFIASYNSSGTNNWVKILSSIGNDNVENLKFNSLGELYLIGNYSNSLYLGNNLILPEFNETDIFVLKLSGSGDFLWVSKISGIGTNTGGNIDINSNGKIILSGYTSNNDIVKNTYLASSFNSPCLFIQRLIEY